MKVFKIEDKSELLFKNPFGDRDIEYIIEKRNVFPTAAVVALNPIADNSTATDFNLIPARTIESTDICPICQEDLLGENSGLIHCNLSCGNNIHKKCLKIWLKHQKSIGNDKIKCPLCRNLFGTVDQIEKRLDSYPKEPKFKNRFVHIGFNCENCKESPIVGNLYKCQLCKDLHLCESCFKDGKHSEHAFKFRSRSINKWSLVTRTVPPTLPNQVINDFQNRELTEDDYGLLLTLDNPQEQGGMPLHIINSFPTLKICNNLNNCKVCVLELKYGEIARRLPCGHGFHQTCVDRWLLNQRSTCPTCGSAAYSSLDMENETGPPDLNSSRYRALDIKMAKRKGKEAKLELPGAITAEDNYLMITGIASGVIKLPPIKTQPQKNLVAKAADISSVDSVNSQSTSRNANSKKFIKRKVSSQQGCKTFGLPPLKKYLPKKAVDVPELIIHGEKR